jgi:hypothetical protein
MTEAALITRKLSSLFFTVLIPFYVGSAPKSGLGTGTIMHSGSVSAKATSYGSCGSGSKTLLVLQNFRALYPVQL